MASVLASSGSKTSVSFPNDSFLPLHRSLCFMVARVSLAQEGSHIGGLMVSVFASSAVVRGFEPRSGQTKDYKFSICCFSAKHQH
jgi:hypothetical protein